MPRLVVLMQDLFVQINFTVVKDQNKLGAGSTAVYEYSSPINWSMFGLIAIALFAIQAGACLGSYKVISDLERARRSLLGYFSLALVSVVYFQYFGNYVMFLLIVGSSNFLVFTLASITLLVTAFLTFKLAFFVFMIRNMGHPDIAANGFRSPRGKFVFYWLIFMLINYVSSTILVRYLSYVYYLIVVSSFPLVNVVENIVNGYKRHFSL